MEQPVPINARIVEALYIEALVLSDEVRHAFAPSLHAEASGGGAAGRHGGEVRLSGEGLRATTRMMQAIAWLLNHRAYLRGELSALQLARSGRLPADAPGGRRMLALRTEAEALCPDLADIAEQTRAFHARLARLDEAWHGPRAAPAGASAVHLLHQTLERRLAG